MLVEILSVVFFFSVKAITARRERMAVGLWTCTDVWKLSHPIALILWFIVSLLRTHRNAEMCGVSCRDVHSSLLYPDGFLRTSPLKLSSLPELDNFVKKYLKV